MVCSRCGKEMQQFCRHIKSGQRSLPFEGAGDNATPCHVHLRRYGELVSDSFFFFFLLPLRSARPSPRLTRTRCSGKIFAALLCPAKIIDV